MSAYRTVRPRDAATLIVLHDSGAGPRVLMGRRHMGHKFMPGKYVFPGGRVEVADWRIRPANDFAPGLAPRLLDRMRGRPSTGRARALALAAIRETFEETGLAIGVADPQARITSRSPAWNAFLATGVQPALRDLRLIARAITPPRRVRRFDTRFFAVDCGSEAELPFLGAPSEELEEIDWVSFDAARTLDLPRVTRKVIDLLEERLSLPDRLDSPAPVPFFYQRGSQWVVESL